MKHLTWEELQLPDDPDAHVIVRGWLERGDGIAVYENQDMGHPELGARKFVSYGSPAAQLETDEPPMRLPDIGNQINWRYTLIGVHRPDEHKVQFGTLVEDPSTPEGYRLENQREIRQSDIMACPWYILIPSHYREDGTCRCNDPENTEMEEWGYTWDSEEGRWS